MFYIKTIEIKWCEHLELDKPIELSEGINLIIGKNGSGKTSILKMLESAKLSQHKGMNGIDETRFAEGTKLVRIECMDENGLTDVISGEKNNSAMNWSSASPIKDKIKFITSDRRVNLASASSNIIPVINKDITIPDPGVEIDVSLEFTTAILKDLFESIESTINKTNIAKDIIEDYKNGLVDFEKVIEMDLRRSSNPVYFKDYKGREIQVQDLSSGEKEYLYFYAFLRKIKNDENKIILIDEPELHLHSSQIRKLCEIISELSKKNQVIIATHSPEVMQSFISSNIVLLSSGKVNNVKSNEDIQSALIDIGLPIDPSIFTARWICAENEPFKKMKGLNAPTTPELLSWIFGNSLENKFWSFGSNKDKADGIMSGIQHVYSRSLPIKLVVIFDGDKKCVSPETYSSCEEEKSEDILYWNFWEIENIFMFPELLNDIITSKDDKSGDDIFWDKISDKKEELFSKSIHKTVLKNFLRQNSVDKAIDSNPEVDFAEWKKTVNELEFDHEALRNKFFEIVKNKKWQWIPGKECLPLLLEIEPSFWDKIRKLHGENRLIGYLEKQSEIKSIMETIAS